jgi:hypothetical protein
VRLYELAYTCHAYGLLAGYDRASADLRRATGLAVDPADERHAAALFEWLRRWGCRQFAIADEAIAKDSLVAWWSECRAQLPPSERTLDELGDEDLEAIESAYESLRLRQASWQRRETGSVARTFGATGAAKTLYAIRPNACPPWDEAIRRRLKFPGTSDGYRQHLDRARTELAEAVAELGPGASAADLPTAIGRPDSSPAKLVDEHDWVRLTRGAEPPPAEVLRRWAEWAALAP